MAEIVYNLQALTGGASNALDGQDGATLTDGLKAFTCYGGKFYVHVLDADSGLTESSPDRIKPDANPGTKVWILQATFNLSAAITGATNETTPLDADDFPFYKASLTALRKVTWTNIKATLKAYFDGVYTLAGLGAEASANKSTNITTDGASDTKYPSCKAVKTYADNLVVGLLDDRGNFDASGNAFPATGGSGTAGAILKGDIWIISVGGTLGGEAVTIGDQVRALVDTPAQTAADWAISEANIGYVPAPATAHYLTDQAESGLSNEVVVTANGKSLVTAANYAAMRTLLNVADGATANNMAAPGAIGWTTPSTIQGWMKELYKTANADSPLTAPQCSKTIVSNYGMTDADCAISLPTAAAGLSFICILPAVRARYFKLRAGAGDKIYLSGTAGSDNGYVGVASGYATGNGCQMFTFKASDGGYDWFCLPIFGTWVAS